MKAIILAAGKGIRLEPITHTRPKPLIPVMNKPLLFHTLDAIKNADINDIFIVVSYLKEKIIEAIENYKAKNRVNIRIVEQEAPLGTGHAVKILEQYVDEPFILVYGDLYIDKKVLKKIVEKKPPIMSLTRVENPREYGVVVTRDDYIIDIIEKPSYEPPSNMINAGVYYLTPEIFHYLDKIKKSPRGEYEITDALKLMIKDNVKLSYIILEKDEWSEIGRPWDILSIHETLLRKLEQSHIMGEVEEYVKIKGPVIIEEGSRIRSGTYITGPVYIGKDTIIGPNSYIRPYSVVGDDVRIGNAVEIKNSVIMEHTRIQHLSYVGDSIICENVNFGAGTITANLRFDEKEVKVTVKGKRISSKRKKLGAIVGGYVKTGINVSLMPGVKIGAYSWIAPGAVVDKDVPKNTFLKIKIEYYYDKLPTS